MLNVDEVGQTSITPVQEYGVITKPTCSVTQELNLMQHMRKLCA